MTMERVSYPRWSGALICFTLLACDIVSLAPGTPDVSIRMDTTEFERSGITGSALVSFLIENRGTGTAYFEGCPEPVNVMVERFDGSWISRAELNRGCGPSDTPARLALDGNKAYAYSYQESEVGRYRMRPFYGDRLDAPEEHSVTSVEFAVR